MEYTGEEDGYTDEEDGYTDEVKRQGSPRTVSPPHFSDVEVLSSPARAASGNNNRVSKKAKKRRAGKTTSGPTPSKRKKDSNYDKLSDAKVLQKEDFFPFLDLEQKKCKECDVPLDFSRSSTVKRHFERNHVDIVTKLVTDFDAKEKAKPKITKFLKLDNVAYNELVNLFSSAPLAIGLIDNVHLQKLLSLIPDFKPPKLRKLKSLMVDKLNSLICYVKENCAGNYFAVGTDCGTTKGMSRSYLAVSIHFIDKKRKAVTCASFEMKELEGSHTAAFLRQTLETVLKSAGLNVNFISKIVADGARNMVNAFLEPFTLTTNETGEETMEANDDETQKKLFEDYEKFLLSDENVDEIQFVMDDFEQNGSPNKLHCVAHRLQLVQKDVFEKDDLLAVRKAVFETISHFARSHQASAELFARSKSRLLFPAATRWSTLTITYERVLKLKDDINIIALQHGWPTLTKQTIDAIENILLLTKDIADFTTQIQSDSNPTISLLFPGLHNIKTNLYQKKYEVKSHPIIDFEDVIDDLISAIDKRFDDVLSTNTENGDPLFAASTLLDSTTAGLFPDLEELDLQQTKKVFYAMAKKLNLKLDEDDSRNDVSTQPLKKNRLGFSIQQPSSQLTSTKTKSFGKEITEFFTAVKEDNWNFDKPIEAWFLHKAQYPKLFEIAMAILPIPATSAAVERMFSQLKIHTDNHKSNSKSYLTRLRVLLSCNKALYDILLRDKIL
uniref:HAT C-terminal dimerisation domain-containing protein n=1 Tax=Panagrolaimus davidi TaxID=227884 RepID=A0A914PN96_9BILA